MKMIYSPPTRFFEDSGAVNPVEAYYVPLDNVTNRKKQDIKTMIDKGRFLSISAPRQSGKTTFFEETCAQLHQDPTYAAIILSFEPYSNLNKERLYELIEESLYSQLINRLEAVDCQKIETVQTFLDGHRLTDHISFTRLFEELNRIIRFKKIVVFIDEFDGMPVEELGNFLSSLRSLYQKFKKEKNKALYSVGLVGIRNITKLVVGGVSPFNIADEVTLPPFSLQNTKDLYGQYSTETNQPFTDGAVKRVHEETAGQPWLVNRLGSILTLDIKPETVTPIDETDVEQAIHILLDEKNGHFDNLFEKSRLYKETFVQIVFDHEEYVAYDEEQSWLEQYGLIKNSGGHAVVGNNIYKAVHLKTFFKEAGADKKKPLREYELPGNKLDMARIMLGFERYIAQIGVRAFYMHEKPLEKTGQFLLTAWLYQFVTGESDDLRDEPLTGFGRMDIMLNYKGRKYIIETKVNRHPDISAIIDEGIKQLSTKYLPTEAVNEGFLVIFDTKTTVGSTSPPQVHQVGEKRITSLTISIGKPV